MANPSYQTIHAGISRKLRINPQVMRESVPQLTFSPSVGIIARDIDKLGMDIRSFREPLKRAVQKVIIPSIQRNFEEEGRPSWEPYSAATLEIRERMGEPVNKLLNKTGALQTQMSRYNIWTVNNNAAILLDIPLWYGKLHQEGYGRSMSSSMKKTGSATQSLRNLNKGLRASIKAGTRVKATDFSIPARPFVMLQEEDIPAIEHIFSEWLQERINHHWSHRG